MDGYLDTLTQWIMLHSLQAWNWATYTSAWALNRAWEAIRAGMHVLRGPQYVFFEGNPRAYSICNTVYYATSAAPVEWLYSDGEFIRWECLRAEGPRRKRHLPLLSMEVVENDEVQYDLTDFVESVDWISNRPIAPSIAHVFEAWSLQSGIVLDTSRQFILRCTLPNARTVDVDFDDLRPLGQVRADSESEDSTSESEREDTRAADAPETCNLPPLEDAGTDADTAADTAAAAVAAPSDLEKID